MIDKRKATSNSEVVQKKIHELITHIDEKPDNSENYLKLATYLIKKGSSDQATELLEKAKNLVTHPQDLDYDLAVCYYLQGEFKKALNILNQIPNNDLVLYQKALVFLKIGQKQKALAYALTIKQRDAKTWELIGDIWLSLGEINQAESSYKKIGKKQRTAKVNFMLGITSLTQNRLEAEKYFAKAKAQDPKVFAQEEQKYASALKLIIKARKKK
ncbi:tetratricopeptide repeat protein [Lactobacillus sp. ESL0260]|nr:tetratricopeptide repeat protein [Lactobacillus sp. ESL0260]RMC58040.1 tetratricopeptide repeat protein [Lactobacillus sp. ESL0260]